MPSSNNKKRPGSDSSSLLFGAVVVVVVAIVLAEPAAQLVTTARKTAALFNLTQIASKYDDFLRSGGGRVLAARPGDTAHDAAFVLARTTQLNDAPDWFVRTDPRLDGASPPLTVLSDATNPGSMNPEFANLPLSYEIVANFNPTPPPLPAGVPFNPPIAWTRGLRQDGTWAPDSPWGGKGGHIAFLDGHVSWFDRLGTAPGTETLFRYGTTIPTTNILESLPPGAVILGAEPGVVKP